MTPEEQAVIDAAYAWRYAYVTPDADGKAADLKLVEAVDAWDIERAYAEDAAAPAPEPQWVAAEWRHVLSGDRVRLGAAEAVIETALPQTWNAKIESKQLDGGRWWDTVEAWRHVKIKVRREGVPGSLELPAGGAVEILMDADRIATHVVMTDLGGTQDTWPEWAREWNRKVMAQDGQPSTFRQHLAAAARTGPQARGSYWTRPGAPKEQP